MTAQRSLFLAPEERQKTITQAAAGLPGRHPKTCRTVARLLWAIETTPPDARTSAILRAKMTAGQRTYNRALSIARHAGFVDLTYRPGTVSAIALNWPRLRQLAHHTAPPAAAIQPPRSEMLEPTTPNAEPAKRTTEVTSPGPGLAPGGWPFPLDRKALSTPATVETLFAFAQARGWIGPTGRADFHALACACARARHLQNPGGAFTRRLKAGDFSATTEADQKAAAIALATLDNPQPSTAPPEAPAAAPDDPDAREAKKARTAAAIKAALHAMRTPAPCPT